MAIFKVKGTMVKQTGTSVTVIREHYKWRCPWCREPRKSDDRPYTDKNLHCEECWLLREKERLQAEQEQFFEQYPYMKGMRVVGVGIDDGVLVNLVLEGADGRRVLAYINRGWEVNEAHLGLEFIDRED